MVFLILIFFNHDQTFWFPQHPDFCFKEEKLCNFRKPRRWALWQREIQNYRTLYANDDGVLAFLFKITNVLILVLTYILNSLAALQVIKNKNWYSLLNLFLTLVEILYFINQFPLCNPNSVINVCINVLIFWNHKYTFL